MGLQMFLPLQRERYKDRSRIVSGELLEGSKLLRGQKAQDTQDLKNFVQDSAVGFSNAFFGASFGVRPRRIACYWWR